MNIHEYQAKQLLKSVNIFVPEGYLAETADEAKSAALKLEGAGCKVFVVKAQVHAGGRGKAGGVKVAKSPYEVADIAHKMLGMKIVTPQTGLDGKIVNKLYIESGSNIVKEYYLSMVLDRETAQIVVVASKSGGMEIEEIAHTNPEEIIKIAINPNLKMEQFYIRNIASKLGITSKISQKYLSNIMTGMHKLLTEKDATQIEINPLALIDDESLICLDAKINFDDNALYKHPEIAEMRDEKEEDELEVEAAKHDLSYIKTSGNIGCMVNGAGLAMSTMDIIKLHGGEPANFLDVGGSATKERVSKAFQIILSDASVKAVLVNIFGGIMRCDIVANGIVEAAKESNLKIPLVVRLEGTNVELGRQIIAESGLNVVSASTLAEAAKKVVDCVR